MVSGPEAPNSLRTTPKPYDIPGWSARLSKGLTGLLVLAFTDSKGSFTYISGIDFWGSGVPEVCFF